MMNYVAIELHGEKQGYCPECGKVAKRHKSFKQTVNPNVNGKLFPGLRYETVYKRLCRDLKKWESEDTYHRSCE
jgi:uncharacterized C2H2 Zn-finger protein